MKKRLRSINRFWTVMIVFCILFSVLPTGTMNVYAATKTVSSYSALKTALTSGSKSVKLGADIKGVKPITIKKGTVTLDLNGHKISGESKDDSIIKVKTGATLNIKSSKKNGGITNTKDQDAIGCVGGKLNIYSGVFKGLSYALYINGGTVNIEGGSFRGNSEGIRLIKGTLILKGGTVTSTDDFANALTQYGGTCKITKAYIEAKGSSSNGFAMLGGTAKMTGGTIKSNGFDSAGICLLDSAKFTMTNGSVSGGFYGITVLGEKKPVTMNIQGGKITVGGEYGHALMMSGLLKTEISGGIFQTPKNYYEIMIEYGSIGTWKFSDKIRKEYGIHYPPGAENSSGSDGSNVVTEFTRNDTKYEKDMYIGNPDDGYSAIMDAFERMEDEISFSCTEQFYYACNNYLSDFSYGIAETNSEYMYHGEGNETIYNVKIEVKNYDLLFQIMNYFEGNAKKSKLSTTAQNYVTKIDNIVAQKISKGMTKRQKIKAIHDYMVKTYSYDHSFKDSSYHFYGPLTNKKAVCQGYAELFFLFMVRLNIPCGTVTGFGNNGKGSYEMHMWNYVTLEGTDYYIDVTWDDSLSSTKYYLKKEKDFYKDGMHIPF